MAWAKREANTNNSEQSVHLVNPIIQTWKYESLSDLRHWPFITRMCRSYQMNEETPAGSRHFSHLCLPFLIQTLHHFLSRCFSFPTSCVTFPPSRSTQTHPPPHTSPSLCTGMLCWELSLTSWVFPWAWSVLESEHRLAFLWLDWMISTIAAAR